jgi:hypothetical protein
MVLAAGAVVGATVAVVMVLGGAQAQAQGPGQNVAMPADKAARVNAERLPANGKAKAKTKATATMPSAQEGLAAPQAVGAGRAPATPPSAGIVNLPQGPFPASVFACRNMYRVPVGGGWIYVFAGATVAGDGGQQAAVRVYQQPDGGAYGLVGVFPAPITSGALTVISASGSALTLRSDGNETVTFDFTKLQYT